MVWNNLIEFLQAAQQFAVFTCQLTGSLEPQIFDTYSLWSCTIICMWQPKRWEEHSISSWESDNYCRKGVLLPAEAFLMRSFTDFVRFVNLFFFIFFYSAINDSDSISSLFRHIVLSQIFSQYVYLLFKLSLETIFFSSLKEDGCAQYIHWLFEDIWSG